MKRKVIAFDLDGTLASSKSPLPDKMAELLSKLLQNYQVCVMSGGKFEQFQTQLLDNLSAEPKLLKNFHLMPTCGTRYYRYEDGKWNKVYAEDFSQAQKDKIIEALKQGVDHFDYHERKIYGETIEDRGSQVSWSALGQLIVHELGEKGVEMKEAWDPTNTKKLNLVDYLTPILPEFEVRAGGTTTIDITKKGIDKAYGMQKLLDMLSISKPDAIFIGDRIIEGGNDYPVKLMGVDCIQVSTWQETAVAVTTILAVG